MKLSLLRPIVAELQRRDIDPAHVLDPVGLSMEAVATDEAAVHVLVIHQFLEVCAEAAGDPCFCARVGAQLSPEGWPMIRDALASARSVGDFLNIYVAGAKAVSTSVTPYLEVRGGLAIFGETRRFKPPIEPAQNDGFMVSLSLSIIEHVLGDMANPARMLIAVVDPGVLPRDRFRAYQLLRGDRMGFRIQFPSDWLTLSVEAHAEATGDRRAPDDFLTGFRQILRQHIGLGGLRAAEAAQLIAMSRPQLARRLTGYGTTISREIADARIEFARAELRKPDRTIEAVATKLGYSDPSNFARMFGRTTGKSPSDYKAAAGSAHDT